jgi:hypothetical protein
VGDALVEANIPDAFIDFFHKWLDSVVKKFEPCYFRYATPREFAYWVAYDGFKLKQNKWKKFSVSVSPVLYCGALTDFDARRGHLTLTGDVYGFARAVPYTYGRDPKTGDTLIPAEFELSVYIADYVEERVLKENPWLERDKAEEMAVIPITDVYMARVIELPPEQSRLTESEYRKLKVLPFYLYEKVYYDYVHELVPRKMLTEQLALVTVAVNDPKLREAIGYAWDKYWEEKGLLAAPPNYARALTDFARMYHKNFYALHEIVSTCRFSLIPENACRELAPRVAEIMEHIYSLFELPVTVRAEAASPAPRSTASTTAGVSPEAHSLYLQFPDVFGDPVAAEMLLKWFCGGYEDLVLYLEERRRSRLLERTVIVSEDPAAVRG